MNRTSKRIIEYPFQALRRTSRRFRQRDNVAERSAIPRRPILPGRAGIFIDSNDLAAVFL
jgi:hypothetical protein